MFSGVKRRLYSKHRSLSSFKHRNYGCRFECLEERVVFAATNWTAGSGDFGTDTNWSNGVPSKTDDAIFDANAGYTIDLMKNGGPINATMQSLSVPAGQPDVDLEAKRFNVIGSIEIGDNATTGKNVAINFDNNNGNRAGSVHVGSDVHVFRGALGVKSAGFYASNLRIGAKSPGAAAVFDDAYVEVDVETTVFTGSSLDITNQSDARMNRVLVGQNGAGAAGTSTLNVDGGSTLTINSDLRAGIEGKSSITIDNGKIEVQGDFILGELAPADLMISSNGKLNTDGGEVGTTVGANATTITVLMDQSLWDAGAKKPVLINPNSTFNATQGLNFKGTLQIKQPAPLPAKGVLAGNIEGGVDQAGELEIGDLGALGNLDIEGWFTQTSTGVTTFDMRSGGQADLIDVTDLATLGGTVAFTIGGNIQPEVGDHWTFLKADSISGAFDNLPAGTYDNKSSQVTSGLLPELADPSMSWRVSYGDQGGTSEFRLEAVRAIVSVSGFEADEYDHDKEFAIQLNEEADYDITVHYTVTDGSATADDDYSVDEPTGTVVIPQGQTVAYVTVHVYGDWGSPEYEGDEDLTIELTQVEGGQLDEEAKTATGTIRDILLSIDSTAEVSEGDGVVTVYVTASATPFELPVIIYYQTQDGTATATASPPNPSDYDAAPMNAYTVLNPGDLSAPIDVTINDDDEMESDEDFEIQLLGADQTFAVLDDAAVDCVVTIHDNDEPPVIYIYDLEHPENKDGGSGDVKLSLVGYDHGLVYEVAWHLEAGSATAGDDFATPASGTLYFGSGYDADQYVTVWVADDYDDEPDEDFYVVIDSVTGGASIDYSLGDGTVTIKDDDKRYRVTALYVDPYDSPETTPLASWFRYTEITAPNTETVEEGSETSDVEEEYWENGGYIVGYQQIAIYANNAYDISVPEYTTGYDVTAIKYDDYDYTSTSPQESWYSYETLTEPDTETVPAGAEENIGEEDEAWLEGGYQDGYTQLPIFKNEEYEEEVPEYLTGYDVTAVYDDFESDATSPDESWYAYDEITAPNTETVEEGAETYLGGEDPAWPLGGYDTGETEDDVPIFANFAYEREIGGTHVVGYHVTAVKETFFSPGDTIDYENWAAYEPHMEHTQTVPRGTYTSLGAPDGAWTWGGYDTGETGDNLNEPIFKNNAYERDLGTTHLVGYHITGIWIDSTYYDGDQIDDDWLVYVPRTANTQTIAAGTYENPGGEDSSWLEGGYDTGRTVDDPEAPIWANHAYERETEGTHVTGHNVTAEYCDPFYGGGLIDDDWAEYVEVEE